MRSPAEDIAGAAPFELWGGPECTVNRVGDRFFDQIELTGHGTRIADLDRFAAMGIKALRYPVLWERVAPDPCGACDWRWTDARLDRVRALGMRPIAGLLHHGSGPRHTSLIDDAFVPLFARYAEAAAGRYPWIDAWTPINEPLTTARFATLYGHWYPHRCDERAFWQAMFNEIEATRAAMRAIRQVNPGAQLVQTEDLGHSWATPEAAHVADIYNIRRWLTFDMLSGRLRPDHPLWEHIVPLGLGDRARALADDPCPPDIIGINHYATSDRFLDHRVDRYGVEGAFHDLAAVRVLEPPPPGVGSMLEQAWARYRLPVAITESHLGSDRDEQMRWLWESYETCLALRRKGIDVRALTAWALVGNVGWSSLLTSDQGKYEPGVIDLRRAGLPRTATERVVQAIGGDAEETAWARAHPVLATPGWWRRPSRLEHEAWTWDGATPERAKGSTRPILITGATGTLGMAFAGACRLRGLDHVTTERAALPIEEPGAVLETLDRLQPWAVINAAGYVRVDEAEQDPDGCFRANAEGAVVLGRACAERGIHYTTFSSDLVFDGMKGAAYVESDAPDPLGVYGASKAEAEGRVSAANPAALIVRTSAFFSPYDPHNFAMHVERGLRAGDAVLMSDQHLVTATYVPDLVRAVLDLIIDEARGIWHLSSEPGMSWFALAGRVASALGLDVRTLRRASVEELGWFARRPNDVRLTSERGVLLPGFEDALTRHVAVRQGAHGNI